MKQSTPKSNADLDHVTAGAALAVCDGPCKFVVGLVEDPLWLGLEELSS